MLYTMLLPGEWVLYYYYGMIYLYTSVLAVLIKCLKSRRRAPKGRINVRLDAEGPCLHWAFFLRSLVLHPRLALNYIFVPLVQKRFARALHPTRIVFE